jgi:hypothetical protein
LPYEYEAPLLLQDGRYWRIWYPDFTLLTPGQPHIEYLGLSGDAQYDARQQHKRRVYADNSIPVLYMTPPDLRNDAGAKATVRDFVADQAASRDVQPRQECDPYRCGLAQVVYHAFTGRYGRR